MTSRSAGSPSATTSGPRRVSVAELEREDAARADELARDEREHLRRNLAIADLDERDPELRAERVEERVLAHEAELDDGAAEPAAPLPLVRERDLELRRVEPTLLHEHLADPDPGHLVSLSTG